MPITSTSYNPATRTLTLVFISPSANWTNDTWYQIIIEGNIQNACDTSQEKTVTNRFKTEPPP